MANNQAPVVQLKDSYIYRINIYPGDEPIGFLLIQLNRAIHLLCKQGQLLTFWRICKHHPCMRKCQPSQGVYIHARNRHNRLATSNIQRPTRIARGTLPPREQTSLTRISAPVKTQKGMRSRLGLRTIRHLAVLFRTPLPNFEFTAFASPSV